MQLAGVADIGLYRRLVQHDLAILFEEEGLAHRSQIIATDISRPALRQAQAARYRVWSMRGVDATMRERYFTYIPGGAAGARHAGRRHQRRPGRRRPAVDGDRGADRRPLPSARPRGLSAPRGSRRAA